MKKEFIEQSETSITIKCNLTLEKAISLTENLLRDLIESEGG